jgi:hypothetical protein
MDKLTMRTTDVTDKNIERIAPLSITLRMHAASNC